MVTEEKLNSNFAMWVERLKKYGCYSEEMINELGYNLKTASFALSANSGCAYEGSMIDTVLNHLCVIAFRMNEEAFGLNAKQRVKHPYLRADINVLMKVLLLQHISKAELFVPQEQAWKLKNGYMYDFNPNITTSLRCGERSIYLCQKYGIKLSEDEYEAIRVIDKDDDNKKSEIYVSPLCQLVKMANQLTSIECHRQYESKANKDIKKIEQ